MYPDKCHLLVSGYRHEVMLAKIDNENIIEAKNVKLLGINIDSKLSFNEHMNTLCK